MDKIVLKDSTTLDIEESNESKSFRMKFTEEDIFLATLKKLSKENLSQYQIQNSYGTVCANPANKECVNFSVKTSRDNQGNITEYDVTFFVSDVDMVEERLTSLEETTDLLASDALGV